MLGSSQTNINFALTHHVEYLKNVEDRLTSWLKSGQPQSLFEIGSDTTLKSADDSGATVRLSRDDLISEEIGVHIDAGKVVTELQMTFDYSLMLVLCSDLSYEYFL